MGTHGVDRSGGAGGAGGPADTSSADVTFEQSGTGATPEDLQSRNRWVLQATDLMSDAQRASIRAGTVTDVTTALQQAAAEARTLRCLVELPEGNLLVTAAVPLATSDTSYCRFRGKGRDRTKILTPASGSAFTIFTVDARSFDGSNYVYTPWGLEELTVEDQNYVAATGVGTNTGISQNGAMDGRARNVTLRHLAKGLLVENDDDGNHYPDSTTYEGVTFDRCTIGIELAKGATGSPSGAMNSLNFLNCHVWVGKDQTHLKVGAGVHWYNSHFDFHIWITDTGATLLNVAGLCDANTGNLHVESQVSPANITITGSGDGMFHWNGYITGLINSITDNGGYINSSGGGSGYSGGNVGQPRFACNNYFYTSGVFDDTTNMPYLVPKAAGKLLSPVRSMWTASAGLVSAEHQNIVGPLLFTIEGDGANDFETYAVGMATYNGPGASYNGFWLGRVPFQDDLQAFIPGWFFRNDGSEQKFFASTCTVRGPTGATYKMGATVKFATNVQQTNPNAGSGTIDVSQCNVLKIGGTSVHTVTDFTNGAAGQELTILFATTGAGETTIQNSANVQLDGGVNMVVAAPATVASLTLVTYDGSVWSEKCRVT